MPRAETFQPHTPVLGDGQSHTEVAVETDSGRQSVTCVSSRPARALPEGHRCGETNMFIMAKCRAKQDRLNKRGDQ